MKVLVACECSGRVREAFLALGHDAWSCDLLPAEDNVSGQPAKQHYQVDWQTVLRWDTWDIVIGFPPCTHLCVSGSRWWPEKKADGRQQEAVEFFLKFTEIKCAWAIENPIGLMSTLYRKPDQIIQPWQFGHGETKATCLWLHDLPKLIPTNVVAGRENRVHKMPPSPNRSTERSRTYQGIANAMANQWSAHFEDNWL